MKTREQITDEILDRNYGHLDPHDDGNYADRLTAALANGEVDYDGIRALINAALLEDRLQHQEYASSDVVVRHGDEVFGLAFEAEIWDIDQMTDDRAEDYERDLVEGRYRMLNQHGIEASAQSIYNWWLDETGEGL